MANKKKTIRLNHEWCRIGDLKRALNECSDSSGFEIVLCTNEPQKEDAKVSRLKDLCFKMHKLLDAAMPCIDICANVEKENGGNVIYYEGKMGYNCGATQLAIDAKDFLQHYFEEQVQIDLAD